MRVLTDEETGAKYIIIAQEKHIGGLLTVKPLSQSPAKETYRIAMFRPGSNTQDFEAVLELTPDAAEKAAKAIEALLAYVQEPIEEIRMDADKGVPYPRKDYHQRNHIYRADEARKALQQDGSAA